MGVGVTDHSPGWRIPQMQKSETRQEQVQGEFFHSESSLADRLVREAIQNSMDARVDPQAPVKVSFTFSGQRDALSKSEAAQFLSGLNPHLEVGALEGSPENLSSFFDRPMPYLAIEDFGTHGLTGDITANSTMERGNNFWGFFRSTGISSKTEGEAGSWGLGKWVFPDASDISAFLGVTQREGESELVLMGQAILRPHSIGEFDYRPYGWFAEYSEDNDAKWLPMPVRDQDFIEEACLAFGIQRGLGNDRQPGLTIVVPFPNEELTPAGIARATVTQYFLPIVNGDLDVEIRHPELGDTAITADTIMGVAGRIQPSDRDDESPESMRSTVLLAQWAATHSNDNFRLLNVANSTFEMSETEKEDYERGTPIGFEVYTNTTRRDRNRREGSNFRIIIERDEGLQNGHDYFVRGFLRVPKMDHIANYHARALVIIDGQSALGHMLRDAEGPAHMEWKPNEKRATQKWVNTPERVREVRRTAGRILQALTTRASTLQRHALADLFPASRSSGGSDTGPGSRGGDNPSPSTPPIPGGPSPFIITQTADGFVVTKNSHNTKPVEGAWRMSIAYDVSRGDPFRAFEAAATNGLLDFSIFESGELSVRVSKSTETTAVADNVLDFDVKGDDFRLQITGFDGRDIAVDIVPAPSSEEDDDS